MKWVLLLILLPSSVVLGHPSISILMDIKGNVYFSDLIQVWRIDPLGEKSIVVIETKIPWSPAGTLAAHNGDFWILEYSETNEVRVERITKEGKRIIY